MSHPSIFRKRPHAPWVPILLITLAGCQAPLEFPAARFGLERQGASSLSVILYAPPEAGFRTQYLRVQDWETLTATLSNVDLAVPPRIVSAKATVAPAGRGRGATLRFAAIQPGQGYRLAIRLLKADAAGQTQVVGAFEQENIEIEAGANTLTIDGGMEAKQQVPVAPTAALGPYVTSLPTGSMLGRVETARDIVSDGAGRFYFVAEAPWPGYSDEIRRMTQDADGQYVISTLAGVGIGFRDGPGAQAQFNGPKRLAIDSQGALYVADSGNHRIRKIVIDATGVATVTTVAGDGTAGYSDGPAGAARFDQPQGIAVDATGTLYVADTGNHRIRKIALNESGEAIVSTLAGDGGAGFRDGSASAAQFSEPRAVAVNDTGCVFVADAGNHRIRRVEGQDGQVEVSTVAGNGSQYPIIDGPGASAQFGNLLDLALDRSGDLIVVDSLYVRRISFDEAGSAMVSAVAGSSNSGVTEGAGASVFLQSPTGLYIDGAGTIYLTQFSAIRRIDRGDGDQPIVSLFAGSSRSAVAGGNAEGRALAGRIVIPTGLALDRQGNVLVSEQSTSQILMLSKSSGYSSWRVVAGDGVAGFRDGPASTARFSYPRGLAVDEDGAIYVADSNNRRIRKIVIDADGNATVSTVAGNGLGSHADGPGASAQFSQPFDLAFDRFGQLYVSDRANQCIRKLVFDAAGDASVSTLVGLPSAAGGFADGAPSVARLNVPEGIDVDAAGNVFIADSGNHRIRKLQVGEDDSPILVTVAGRGTQGYFDGPGASAMFASPTDVCVDTNGDLVVSDTNNSCIRKISTDHYGNVAVSSYVGGGRGNVDGPASQAQITGVGPLALGDSGHLFFVVGAQDGACLRRVIP